jgi:phosphate transport system permease protein
VRSVEGSQAAVRDERLRLERSYSDFRSLLSTLLSIGTGIVTVIACIPLFSVLIMLLWRGGAKLSWQLFVELPPTAFEDGGGFGNAIVGTVVMVGIAALMSVPFGILAAVFLAEFGPDSRLAGAVRFCAKTLTGLPSILAGVFAYAAVVLLTGTYSAPAGGAALAVLIFNFAGMPFENQIEMAWAAALVLVLLVFVINIAGQLFSRRRV